MNVGTALGILIGFVSLVPLALFVRTAYQVARDSEASMGRVSAICAELFAMPGFWFGGPWLSSMMLTQLDWGDLTEPYIIALTFTFVPVGAVLVLAFIAKVAWEIFSD